MRVSRPYTPHPSRSNHRMEHPRRREGVIRSLLLEPLLFNLLPPRIGGGRRAYADYDKGVSSIKIKKKHSRNKSARKARRVTRKNKK